MVLIKIKRSTERLLWLFALIVAVGVFYIAPVANSFKNENDISYYEKLFRTAFQYLNEYYVDSDHVAVKDLYYGAIQGMFQATGDPYTSFLEPKILRALLESIQGEFEGIGAYVGVKDNRVMIISPIEGTPAYKAGLRPGDIIMKIEDKDTEGMKLEEAVSLLRGPANSKVRVEIYRKGVPRLLKVTIQRKKIEIPSVRHTMLPRNTGYIKINNFGEHTPDELKNALNELVEKGMEKLVIDLRFNPGGSLNAVVEVADFFLKKGLVVYTIGKKTEETKKYFSSDDTEVDPELPIVVLVNEGSASASEIFAGAMKDRKRGVIIGEKTFGKGTVQNVFKILDKNDMLGLRITIAKYYTPGGYVIAGKGIEPEVKVSMPKMTPEEEFFSIRLLNTKAIEKFVARNPKTLSDAPFQEFKRGLVKQGIKIRDIFLKKLIREEQNISNGPQMVDLDYDAQLNKALEILEKK